MSKTTYCTALLGIAVVASMSAPVLADSNDGLAMRVQTLESRVKELEGKLNEERQVQAPQIAPLPTATGGITAVDKTINPANATPGQRQQLPAPQPAAEPPDLVHGGSFPGSFRLPGSNTSIGVHGWVDLQAFFDPQQYLGDKFQVGDIRVPGNAKRQLESSYHFQSKLTRLIIETRTPTKLGPFKTYFASDFYGFENGGSTGQQAIQNNNYGFRPVHIYGVLGGFLAGKTWSNFIDDPDSLESLDNAGASGVPSEQVLQLRYTKQTKIGDFSLSAENPVTDYASNDKIANVELTSKYNPRPDFALKYEIQRKWGHAQLSGVTRKLAYDDGKGHRSEAEAGGGIAGVTINLPRRSALGAQVWFGNGIMKFTPDDFGPVSSAQINNIGTDQQVLIPSNEHGLTIFAAHEFSPALRSNIGFGYNAMHWNHFIPADSAQPEITHTLHTNIIWSPIPAADFGLEYIHGLKTFRYELNFPESYADRYEAAFKFRF